MKLKKRTLLSLLVLFFVFLFGCEQQEIRKTPPKENVDTGPQKSEILQEIKNGPKQLTVTCNYMLKNRGFGLFYNDHARLFEVLATTPVSKRASSSTSYVVNSTLIKGKESAITIKDLQNSGNYTRIRRRAVHTGLINKIENRVLPDDVVVTSLFLNADVKEEFENDSLYRFFQTLLKDQRPLFNSNAQELFEVMIEGDSIFVEGDFACPIQELSGDSSSIIKDELNTLLVSYLKNQGPEKGIKKQHVATYSGSDSSSIKNSVDDALRIVLYCDSTISTKTLLSVLSFWSAHNLDLTYSLVVDSQEPIDFGLVGKHDFVRVLDSGIHYRRELDYTVLVDSLGGGLLPLKPWSLLSIKPDMSLQKTAQVLKREAEDGEIRLSFDTTDCFTGAQTDSSEIEKVSHKITMLYDSSEIAVVFKIEVPAVILNMLAFSNGGEIDSLQLRSIIAQIRESSMSMESIQDSLQQITKGDHVFSVTGQRSKESVERVIETNAPSLHRAYEKALRDNKKLQGRVVFKLLIGEFGSVDSLFVIEFVGLDDDLVEKVTKKVGRWSFGKIAHENDTTEVIYPIVFRKDIDE